MRTAIFFIAFYLTMIIRALNPEEFETIKFLFALFNGLVLAMLMLDYKKKGGQK